MQANQVIEIFNQSLGARYGVALIGGGDEPFYRARQDTTAAVIVFRADFSASALHEVAHWCLAGRRRRQLDDYGYWYLPARNAPQQAAFEAVEARPQALESLFAEAAGVDFQVSTDDVAQLPSEPFKAKVASERCLMRQRLPLRATCFLDALVDANPGKGPPLSRSVPAQSELNDKANQQKQEHWA